MDDFKSIVSICELDYPVLSFDKWGDKFIALLYQVDGENKLSVRTADNKEELYYMDLGTSGANVLVRFYNDPNQLLFFNGRQISLLNIEEKKVALIRTSVLSCCFDYKVKKLFFVLATGEAGYWQGQEVMLPGKLQDITSRNLGAVVMAYAAGREMIVIAQPFKLMSIPVHDPSGIAVFSTKHEEVRDISVDDHYNYAGIVGMKPRGVWIYMTEDKKPYLPDIFKESLVNQFKIAFMPGSDILFMCSTIGYISMYDIKDGKQLHSAQVHKGLVRDMIFPGDGLVYSSGDDGKVFKINITV